MNKTYPKKIFKCYLRRKIMPEHFLYKFKDLTHQFLKQKEYQWLLILTIFYFLTRLLIFRPQQGFWDSLEYISRITTGNFTLVLSSGHPAYHPLYLFLSYLANIFIQNPVVSLTLVSFLSGLGAVICSYFIGMKIFSDLNKAIIGSIFFLISPLWWIANTAVLTDSTAIFFYLFSFLIMIIVFEDTNHVLKKRILWSLFAGIILGFSFLTATYVILLTFSTLPISFILFYKYNSNLNTMKQFFRNYFLLYFPIIIGFCITSFPLYILVFSIGNHSFNLFSVGSTNVTLSFSYILTSLIVLIKGINWLIFLLACISIFELLIHIPSSIRQSDNFVLLLWFCFTFPFLIFYAYGSLLGRLFFSSFVPLAFLAGNTTIQFSYKMAHIIAKINLKKNIFENFSLRQIESFFIILIFGISLVIGASRSLPYHNPVPYNNYKSNISNVVNKNDTILCTNDDFPWIKNCKTIWSINDINTWLLNGSRVLLDNQVIFSSWWTYDGFERNSIINSQLLQKNILSFIPNNVLELFKTYQIVLRYDFSAQEDLWFYQILPSNFSISNLKFNDLFVNSNSNDKIINGTLSQYSLVIIYPKNHSLINVNQLWDPLSLIANLFYTEPIAITLTNKFGDFAVPIPASLYSNNNYIIKTIPFH